MRSISAEPFQSFLKDGRLGLLDLQEQRILPVASEQQRDPGARANAADPDHLAGEVDQAVALEQEAPVTLEARAVGAQELVQPVEELVARAAGEKIVDLPERRSSIGTISGGSARMRGSPSTM
jgi:hypothetical protein